MNIEIQKRSHGIRRTLIAAAAGFALVAGSAAAADPAPTPTESTVINLIRLMVQRGLLTQTDADGLIRQAQAEAAQARTAAAAAPATTASPPENLAPGSVFVPYVPQIVKDEIKEQLRQEVMAKAQAEKWASPGMVPDWSRRITLSGDLRFRDEFQLLDDANAIGLVDYATLNADGPYDINEQTNVQPPPLLNTVEDQNNLMRIRARLNVAVSIADEVSANLRLATGNNNGPVSTNQTLGGGLGKKDLWLDRAWIDVKPTQGLSLLFGRMPNPYLATDLIWDEDLNFDGAAAKYSRPLFGNDDTLKISSTVGAFPIQYGDSSFPTTSAVKGDAKMKWLFGAQVGADWLFNETDRVKFGLAYYDYTNVRGQVSESCAIYLGLEDCSSDPTVPPFMQKGNTLFLIRQIAADPNSPDSFAQPQFVGLTFDYELLDVALQLDMDLPGAWRHLSLLGDFVTNLAYDRAGAFRDLSTLIDDPVTNRASNQDGTTGPYQSGSEGWLVKAMLGDPVPSYALAWNVSLAYKYLEPDAVLDAYTDSDFHLGGTNAQGWVLGAGIGLYRNTWASLRWFSADEVYGPPLAIDVLQLDLNVKF